MTECKREERAIDTKGKLGKQEECRERKEVLGRHPRRDAGGLPTSCTVWSRYIDYIAIYVHVVSPVVENKGDRHGLLFGVGGLSAF